MKKNSPIIDYLSGKQKGIHNNIKRLLPDNISSGNYIKNEARKYIREKNNLSTNNLNTSFKNIMYTPPSFDGKLYDPTINKTINKLKKDEKHLINEITKINSNELLLKNKAYIKVFNNNKNLFGNDQKIINDKIKVLEKNKNIYIDKLDEIKTRIDSLQYNQEKELGIIENNNKIKFNKFIEDYNNKENKSFIENKIKKLRKESDKIQFLMQKDIKKQIDKKTNEINNKKQEEELEREAYLKKIQDEERFDIEKRKKKNTGILIKLKTNIFKSPKDKMYLYQKNIEKFLNNENYLVELEKIKRKEFMRKIDLDELDENRKNFEQIKSQKQLESIIKIDKIHKLWEERHKLLPLYSSPLSKKLTEEEKKNKQEEQNKIERIIKLKTLQKSYSKFKIPMPILKKKFIVKSIENESKRTSPKKIKQYFIKSNSYSNLLRQNIINKFKEKQNNKSLNQNATSGEIDSNSKILKQNDNIHYISFEKNKKENKNKTIDYLKERRKVKELNKEKQINFKGFSNWDCYGASDMKKLIKNNGINDKTLELAKSKLNLIEEKTKQKNSLLKLSGGIINKPELGDEVCGLMIDSIQAKLSILEGIDQNLNDIKESEELNNIDNNNDYLNLGENDLQEKTIKYDEEEEQD